MVRVTKDAGRPSSLGPSDRADFVETEENGPTTLTVLVASGKTLGGRSRTAVSMASNTIPNPGWDGFALVGMEGFGYSHPGRHEGEIELDCR
jgi:hypothetical protein